MSQENCDHEWHGQTDGIWCAKCGSRRYILAAQPERADIEAVLTEREKTHGDYEFQCAITRDLKAAISLALANRERRHPKPLAAAQLEALDMIAVKIGRIIAGDPNFADHWEDIAGYAMLGARKAAG